MKLISAISQCQSENTQPGMSSELFLLETGLFCKSIDIYFWGVLTVLALTKENGSGCLDTVGAVVVDLEGNVAAAVSSGGLAMKHPGRVGQVGLPLFF